MPLLVKQLKVRIEPVDSIEGAVKNLETSSLLQIVRGDQNLTRDLKKEFRERGDMMED